MSRKLADSRLMRISARGRWGETTISKQFNNYLWLFDYREIYLKAFEIANEVEMKYAEGGSDNELSCR